jgi:DEAD/DEAH box helicase domain-containing protein
VNKLIGALRDDLERAHRITHIEVTPARVGRHQAWPDWVPDWIRDGYGVLGVTSPWAHQVEAMEAARQGHTVIATATGSGKSLALWTPLLTALSEPLALGRISAIRTRPSALYLAPSKALAADQMNGLQALFKAAQLDGIYAATCDGDTPAASRGFIQSHVDLLASNPDFLHFSLLPGHAKWSGYLRGLRYVVVDELHAYRGVMGAHVAWVMRRLRRVARHYGADPVFLAASATVSQPAVSLARLIGAEPDTVRQVCHDSAAHGEHSLVLWRPAAVDRSASVPNGLAPKDDAAQRLPHSGDLGAPVDRTASGGPDNAPGGAIRRSASLEAARLLADLAEIGARSVTFVRSRYSAEAVADQARDLLGAAVKSRVATYRGGYLPEERRELERRLRNGSLLAVVSTSALELGIDLPNLDAVLIAGWPGTLIALRQQAGRAGRAAGDGLAVWIAGNDPLDTYIAAHPETVVDAPLEATVFDPSNPYVMAPHLAAATAELPLSDDEATRLGPDVLDVLESLAESGALRRRSGRWFWVLPERATDLTDLRGSGGTLIQLAEQSTGRILGTVDSGRAPAVAHPGAVYLHQGESFLVTGLDLKGGLALLEAAEPHYRTMPLSQTRVAVIAESAKQETAGPVWHFGTVDVTSQVVGYMRLRLPGLERIGSVPLDLPESTLRTAATWVTVPQATLSQAGLTTEEVPGALHAAEHAAIGLLPLLATCDRWDLGGLSTAIHQDTGQATIFIHDAVPGGAGFAERGFQMRANLFKAVRELLLACPCEAGCPSCIQSPKCGNANQVLSKAGALALVTALVAA